MPSGAFWTSLLVAGVAWDEVFPLLLPLPLILSANWKQSPPGGPGLLAALARGFGAVLWPALAVIAAGCVLIGLLALAGARGARLSLYGALMVLTGLLAASLLEGRTRLALSRVLPIRPSSPLDATALVLTVVLVGSQLANQLAVDVLTQQRLSGPRLAPVDLVAQEVPFLLAALLGVGLFTRRPLGAALDRLGLVRPAAWQLALALAAAGLFFAFSTGVDLLSQRLTPDLAHKVDAANQRLFGRLGDPLGVATIALAAGICEEVLFRGALQPRLGIVWTSLVFAAVHSQYGLSFDAMAVFVLALCLGFLRVVANTSTTVVCHVAYNALVGIGVSGSWLLPALLGEATLILLTVVTFFTTRVGTSRLAQ